MHFEHYEYLESFVVLMGCEEHRVKLEKYANLARILYNFDINY
jgi:hypothetical protein